MANEQVKQEQKKNEQRFFLINNDSKRIIKINGVRMMVGINRVDQSQVEKLKASPYFKFYFDDEAKDKLNWVKGFSPDDKEEFKDILALSFDKSKKIIKGILDINLLKELEIKCEDAKLRDVILAQIKEVLPTSEELK